MKKRYLDLRTQYISDLERLNFIVDSAINKTSDHTRSCPFCSSSVKIQDSTNYIASAQSEHKKVNLQLKDLDRTILSISKECVAIENEINNAIKRYSDTKTLIEKELQPYADALKEKMRDYRNLIKLKAEINALDNQSARMTTKVTEIANADDSTLFFKVKEHIPTAMIDWLNKFWPEVLKRCKFDNIQNAYFDKRTMDVVVDGQSKADYGKGYRAYLNTLNALGIMLYLRNEGKYYPPLLVLDSPILSLKERIQSDELVPSPMRTGLFQELKACQDRIQIIIAENEIPPIDYSNVHVIEFTKSTENGRYGFLMDVVN